MTMHSSSVFDDQETNHGSCFPVGRQNSRNPLKPATNSKGAVSTLKRLFGRGSRKPKNDGASSSSVVENTLMSEKLISGFTKSTEKTLACMWTSPPTPSTVSCYSPDVLFATPGHEESELKERIDDSPIEEPHQMSARTVSPEDTPFKYLTRRARTTEELNLSFSTDTTFSREDMEVSPYCCISVNSCNDPQVDSESEMSEVKGASYVEDCDRTIVPDIITIVSKWDKEESSGTNSTEESTFFGEDVKHILSDLGATFAKVGDELVQRLNCSGCINRSQESRYPPRKAHLPNSQCNVHLISVTLPRHTNHSATQPTRGIA